MKFSKELRQSILLNAIQGKLSSSLATDTPIENTLNIMTEHCNKLYLSKECKRTNPVNELDGIELFEIPESWKWVKLANVGTLTRGKGIQKKDVIKEGMPCVRYGQLYTTFKTKFEYAISFISNDLYTSSLKAKQNDVLMSLTGENNFDIALAVTYLGNDNIAIGGDMTCWSNHFMNPLYLTMILNSEYGISCKRIMAKGNIIVHISNDKLAAIPLPLPPIEEQDRIVAKVDELMAKIDEYEKLENELEELKKQFPNDMKDAILQAAMEGKLTQRENYDSLVAELLLKIKENKELLIKNKILKKSKTDLTLSKEDCLFDIPDNWKWIRLGNISTIYGGKRIPVGKSLTEINTGHKYIRVADMKNGSINLEGIKYITDDVYESIKKYYISKKDLYITVAGTIGQVGEVPDELDMANLTENADKIVFDYINKKWLLYVLNSNLVQSQIHQLTTKVGQPKLALQRIETLVLPLPSLEEQQRIVEVLDRLLPLCDELYIN